MAWTFSRECWSKDGRCEWPAMNLESPRPLGSVKSWCEWTNLENPTKLLRHSRTESLLALGDSKSLDARKRRDNHQIASPIWLQLLEIEHRLNLGSYCWKCCESDWILAGRLFKCPLPNIIIASSSNYVTSILDGFDLEYIYLLAWPDNFLYFLNAWLGRRETWWHGYHCVMAVKNRGPSSQLSGSGSNWWPAEKWQIESAEQWKIS